jgi:hypothetical protein
MGNWEAANGFMGEHRAAIVHETKRRPRRDARLERAGLVSIPSRAWRTWEAGRILCDDTDTQVIRRPEWAVEVSDGGIGFPWDESVVPMQNRHANEAKKLRG